MNHIAFCNFSKNIGGQGGVPCRLLLFLVSDSHQLLASWFIILFGKILSFVLVVDAAVNSERSFIIKISKKCCSTSFDSCIFQCRVCSCGQDLQCIPVLCLVDLHISANLSIRTTLSTTKFSLFASTFFLLLFQ